MGREGKILCLFIYLLINFCCIVSLASKFNKGRKHNSPQKIGEVICFATRIPKSYYKGKPIDKKQSAIAYQHDIDMFGCLVDTIRAASSQKSST